MATLHQPIFNALFLELTPQRTPSSIVMERYSITAKTELFSMTIFLYQNAPTASSTENDARTFIKCWNKRRWCFSIRRHSLKSIVFVLRNHSAPDQSSPGFLCAQLSCRTPGSCFVIFKIDTVLSSDFFD